MSEFKVQPKSLGGFVRSVSGLFISKSNKHGLSPKECTLVSLLRSLLPTKESKMSKLTRQEVSNQFNQSLQVTTNYINRLKKKGVIMEDESLHPVLYETKIVIEWKE